MAFLVWHPLEFIDNSYTELFEFLTHNFLSIIFICHGTVPIYVFLYFPSHQLLILISYSCNFLLLAYLAHVV